MPLRDALLTRHGDGRLVDLSAAQALVLPGLAGASRTGRILTENLLRRGILNEHSRPGSLDQAADQAGKVLGALTGGDPAEFDLYPSRVILQDHSGVPVLSDLASLRSLLSSAGRDPQLVSPQVPVDLVVDHSVEAHSHGSSLSLASNMRRELTLNSERYRLLRWAQREMAGVRVIPPGQGIVHQMHLERLAQVVGEDRSGLLVPDTVMGTDSHTPMVNALGVLGWGIGGLEATAILLGMPVTLRSQPVLGVRLSGRLRPGVLATDLALTMTQKLRSVGVVNTMLEFHGPGLRELPLPERATVANMAPEYGCTTALFPVDAAVLDYLRLTGRPQSHIDLVEDYCRRQGLFADPATDSQLSFAEVIDFDLDAVEPSASGPRRPQDRVPISGVPKSFKEAFPRRSRPSVHDAPTDGAIAIAAITSCTSTSNPASMLTAGLLARKAVERGMTVPGWVKTSLAPGSKSVTNYLSRAGLTDPLAALGFSVVGFGCTTCIGNSGPLASDLADRIRTDDLATVAVLSGNRNFEGRIHRDVAAAYLMSPPLVVAYALAGSIHTDLSTEVVGIDREGKEVTLADLWPTPEELESAFALVRADSFAADRDSLFEGDAAWQALDVPAGALYDWPPTSTYLMPSPLVTIDRDVWQDDIRGARVLVFADHGTTTDHISPAGQIPPGSPAGEFLNVLGVAPEAFNSYGCRRGNHEVMMRGTFAGSGLRNKLADRKGGFTRSLPDGEQVSVYDAAIGYAGRGVPLVVLGGRDYGMGSSRDWAAKGPRLLGVRAVLAESFERIHRSNLVGVGILPLQFIEGDSAHSLGLTGEETFDLDGLAALTPRGSVQVTAYDVNQQRKTIFRMQAQVDTDREIAYLRGGGLLPVVAAEMAAGS